MVIRALENKALVLDLVEWLDERPRAYVDVMAAWQTSCPRLPIWEDAVEHGFILRRRTEDAGPIVTLTEDGRTFLRLERGARSSRRSA